MRWRPPQPAAPWTGVRQAAEFGASCMQGRGSGRRPAAAGAPRCSALRRRIASYLNVWRPADPAARNLPVMVWIYGGGFMGGSSSSPNTSGVGFAKQGVILVAMNYRVGRFGFFAFPALSSERPDENKGNYAYMDQIAALQWVKRNIAAFGGNPDNVTIFGFSAGGVSVHSMLASPQARGLFHKAIVESGGSRDSVLTARPMREDGVDPNYPVSAETIGIQFARSMGIEGTDQAALAKLRGLSAEQVLRGAPAQPGTNAPSYETTPILDGKLITETAESAYKARRQPRVPLLLGSNSADTAGNRIRAATKDEFFARFGKWSAEARAAYDPDGSTDLATLVSRANDDFGQAEPARFAANAFAANGSPVYLYRFSYVQSATAGASCGPAPRTAAKSPMSSARWAAGRGRCADARGSGGLPDGAKLLGQLRQDGRPERCGPADLATSRPQEGSDLRFPARWLCGRRSRSAKGAARRDAEEHRLREAFRFLKRRVRPRGRNVRLEEPPPYSARRAIIGSTRDARRAGMRQATSDTPVMTSAVPARVAR